ncbi:MAG: LTA synthase family protein [Ruminococcaceae bacterium]|nr:LTA synthase family protein [Oscillospiraceae bacterium]
MFTAIFKPRKEANWLTVNITALFWAFIIFWLMQLAVSASISSIFKCNIVGVIAGNILVRILSGVVRIIMNTLIIYALIMTFSLIFKSMKVGIISVLSASVILGIANNFVVQTRGREISFNDIKSIGTALAVVGDYSFSLMIGSIISIILSVVAIVYLVRSDYPKFSGLKKSMKHFLTAALTIVLCVTTVFSGISIGYASRNYRSQGTEYNGYYLNFIYSIKNSRIKAPVTYSPGAILDAIEKNDFSSLVGSSKDVNVIVIMNESFANLKEVCDNSGAETKLETNVELLPYWNSIENGVFTFEDGSTQTFIKGNALSSVYGGNTANSEYEFLSGSSMAFIPEGSVVYNGKLNEENSYTLVDFFNYAGYRTVGIHPEQPENWSRNSIYKYFGFDEVYFKGDFSEIPAEDYYRGHVSDKAIYDRIIDIYETKEEGEKLFTFAVTMMNHGGYNHSSFEPTVTVEGDSAASEYLSSANESDKALEYLMDYFDDAEEETLIVVFGDHQPTMSSSFTSLYMGIDGASTVEDMQKMYTIPYLFWSNFEMDSDINDSLTSINYLSTAMLDICGIRKSAFFETIDNIREVIPAINAFGWYDIDGDFHDFKDVGDTDITVKEKELLELYEHLIFNLIFDEDNKLVNVFGLPKVIQNHTTVHEVESFHKFRYSPKVFGANN